jgi:hypothetical protein
MSKVKMGENNPSYIDGSTPKPYCPKWNKNLRERIRAFFGYRCLLCGMPQEENGCALSCHHVARNKQTCCDNSIPMFAPLCLPHHSMITASRPENKARWQYMLSYIIQVVYEGKSFLPKPLNT